MDVALGGDGAPVMRMRVGHNNVDRVENPSPSEPDAWLRVLGQSLRLRLRDGTTSATWHRHSFLRCVDIRAEVSSIDLDSRTVRLSDGSVVRVTGRTLFVHRRGYARSLRAAADALASGKGLQARVIGVVERNDPLVLALTISLKIVEREPVVMEFEGVVMNASTVEGATVLSLLTGANVQVVGTTELVAADEDSPADLGELMQALEESREVIARGTGHVTSEHPLVLKGVRVVLDADAPTGETPTLVGTADFVDVDGSLMLLDGTRVLLTGSAEVSGADANSPATFAELASMLDQDLRIQALVFGTVDSPTQITAERVVLRALVRAFNVDVLSIDFGFGRLFFEGGTVGVLTPSSVITAVGDGPTDLIGVDEALGAGDRVRAAGNGFVMGRAEIPGVPESVSIIAVEFDRITP
jgi:hypothetical protein